MKYIKRLIATYTGSVALDECPSCGCLVSDTVVHDKFHENLGNVARSAYSADARPIR